jgi:cytidyltransferase-like protein
VVVYPGRFQPFHRGHKEVYDYLCRIYGNENVWIVTSDKVEPPRSPFNFEEKLEMMKLTGVDPSRVIRSSQPYRAEELIKNFDPQTTRAIFAVSTKDMTENPRFKFGVKRDGTPTYYQPISNKNLNKLTSLDKHGYIEVVPTFKFKIQGEPMQSATTLRRMFAQADEKTQKNIVRELFGRYDPKIYAIMKNKILEQAGVGVVATNCKMANDPRYSTSMTVDVKPTTPQRNARALRLA